MNRLSVGLLIGSEEPSRWFTRSVQKVVSECNVAIESVVIPDAPENQVERSTRYYIRYALQNKCWAPLELLNKIRGGSRMAGIPELREEPITAVSSVAKEKMIYCDLERSGSYRVAIPDEVVRELSDLDIVFHAGVGIISGSVLDVPRYGVWGIHHGDVRKYRGGPPGFWEYVNDEQTAVITLQRYTEELDAGQIILEKEVDISSARTWPEVRRIMCRETVPVFMQGVKKHVRRGKPAYSVDELGPIYTRSDRGCVTLLKYLSRSVPGRIRAVRESSNGDGATDR